jgi:alanine-synthesizing transaminase
MPRGIPRGAAPNEWARRLAEQQASGSTLFDLTEANPTRVGLSVVTEAVSAALAAAASAPYAPDPRGAPAAREAISAYYRDRSLAADPAQLVLTAGTSEAYVHVFRLLTEPGDFVLAPAPSYPLFEPLAALEGVGVRTYPLQWDGRWHVDLAELERRLADGPRAVIVVQPNHPTGSCLGEEELAALERACERRGIAMISDEVFGDFAWDGRAAGLASLVGERRALTFVLSGLSKVCGMPQMKLGWIWCGGPARDREPALEGLEWIADLFLSVGSPVQSALSSILETRHAFRSRALDRIAVNRARLKTAAQRCPELTPLDAEGGWAAILRLPERRDEESWTIELLKRGVIVHPGHFYDLDRGSHIVVSLIVEPDVFDRGMTALEQLVASG